MQKTVYLLGGHDLEMLEIKNILNIHKCIYIDKNLQWGAKLSVYKKDINNSDLFVGIELELDINPPLHYKVIDHHGEHAHKPSSLEQVATLVGHALTHEQHLISINDAHYIKGMRAYGATEEEIKRIRQKDRKAQGASDEDERLAEKVVKAAGTSNVFYSTTPYFSCISDRVSDKFECFIIYNEVTVSFYGYSIEKLIDVLNQQKIEAHHYYYGGGKNGFLGFKTGALDLEKIKKLIESTNR